MDLRKVNGIREAVLKATMRRLDWAVETHGADLARELGMIYVYLEIHPMIVLRLSLEGSERRRPGDQLLRGWLLLERESKVRRDAVALLRKDKWLALIGDFIERDESVLGKLESEARERIAAYSREAVESIREEVPTLGPNGNLESLNDSKAGGMESDPSSAKDVRAGLQRMLQGLLPVVEGASLLSELSISSEMKAWERDLKSLGQRGSALEGGL